MKRYYTIKDETYIILNNECFGNNRKDGLEHLFNVANMASLLAKKEHLDSETAAIIGILHDLATYKYCSSFDHANRSSILAKDILSKSKLFSNEEILVIATAIKNHSFKERIDDQYSELIKNADLLVQHLNEPEVLFSKEKQLRLNKIFTTLQMT